MPRTNPVVQQGWGQFVECHPLEKWLKSGNAIAQKSSASDCRGIICLEWCLLGNDERSEARSKKGQLARKQRIERLLEH